MMDPAPAARARLERFIVEQGMKHTRQRDTILEEFMRAGGHVSVEDLLRRVQILAPGLGAATVYRTLKLFVDAGIAHERNFGDGQARYEPAVDNEHHDHLICTDCGTIFEFEDPQIESRQSEIARQYGLELLSHRHDIHGTCLQKEACPRWPRA